MPKPIPIYAHHPDDIALWRQYIDFHLRLCAALWSPALIERPYGTVKFSVKDDWGDLLWRANDTPSWSADTVIADVAHLSANNLNRPGFYINPAYDETFANALENRLVQHGYKKRHQVCWMILEQLSADGAIVPPHVSIADADNVDDFLFVHKDAFPEYDFEETYRRHVTSPDRSVNIRFIMIRDKHNRAPLAVGGLAWDGRCGYLFGLGVHHQYRRQGLGRLMVEWRLQELAKQRVEYVVTGVMTDNEASYALQIKKGYRQFSSAECWLKPRAEE